MPELNEQEEFNPSATTPVDGAVEYIESRTRIQDYDNVVGLCSECKSVQPNTAMEKSAFAQNGVAPVCRYCGGVVVVTYGELVGETMNNALDYQRGIGRG